MVLGGSRTGAWAVTFGLGFCRLVSHAIRVLPATLAKQLAEADHLSNFQYSTLNSIYVLPSCITPLFCGYLVDLYGSGKCMVIFTLFIAVGQIVFSFGEQYGYSLSIIGRLLGGCTWMALDSLKIPLVKEIFGNTAQALPMTVTDVGARLGILMSFLTIAKVYDEFGLSTAFLLTSALGSSGFLVSLIVEKYMEAKWKQYQVLDSMELISPGLAPESSESSVYETSDSPLYSHAPSAITVVTEKEPDKARVVPWDEQSSLINTKTRDDAHDVNTPIDGPSAKILKHGDHSSNRYIPVSHEVHNEAEEEKYEGRALGAEFYVLNLMVALCYAGCPTFILFASQFFQEVYSDSFEQANLDSSMIENFVIIMGPLGGAFIDRFGGRSVMLLIGIIIINIGNIFVIMAEEIRISAFSIGCILGFGWSAVYVSAWSLVPVTVKNPKSLGLGAGITGCSQNIGMLVGTTVVGLIEDWDHSVRKKAVTEYFLFVGGMVLVVNLYFIFVVETKR